MWNQVKTALLLGLLAAILLGVGYFFAGTTGLTIGLTIALIINLLTYFFSAKLVLWMYNAKEADKKHYAKLYQMVREVAHAANVPMPKVYIIPEASPNAFATGRNPKNGVVACTEGILKLLNDDELKGVIAHEMGHVKNRDILIATIAATIAAAISYAGHIAMFGDDDNPNIVGLILLWIVLPLVAMLIQLAISRSREYLADETAAKITHNPKALASALRKITGTIEEHPMEHGNNATASLFIANPFSGRKMISWFSTHPPVEERIARLNAMKFT